MVPTQNSNIDSGDFIDTFASQKSQKLVCIFTDRGLSNFIARWPLVTANSSQHTAFSHPHCMLLYKEAYMGRDL
jgi:hypothetical protein